MKGRDSGMPEEAYWNSFFDPEATLDMLLGGIGAAPVLELGCGYGTFTLPLARTLLDKYPWGRKRWLEGAIATDPRRAGDYALRSIPIGERWTEGEPAIAEAILTRTGRVRDCAIRYYIAHVLGVVLRAPVDLDPAYPIKAKEWAKAVHAGQPRQAAVA